MKPSKLDHVLDTPIDETSEGAKLTAIEKEFDVAYCDLVESLVTELSAVFLNPNFETTILPGIIDTWFNEPHLKSLKGLKTAFLRWLEDNPPFKTRGIVNDSILYVYTNDNDFNDKLARKVREGINAIIYSSIASAFSKEIIDPNNFAAKSNFSEKRHKLILHLTNPSREYTPEDFAAFIAELKGNLQKYLIDFRADVSYLSGIIKEIRSGKVTLQQGVSELIDCEAKETLEEMMAFLKTFRDNKTEYSTVES